MGQSNKRIAVRAFISYSHRDERLREFLETHLTILKRTGLLEVWHDRKIVPGTDVNDEIDAHINTSDLVLLLVSPDFLASEYCYSREVKLALSRHAAGYTRVVPIILRPVDWREAPFSHLLALPKDGKAVTSWRIRDKALEDVTEGLRVIISQLQLKPAAERALPEPDPYAYQGSVLQVGGIGSRVVTKTAWTITEPGYLPAEKYITHSFNRGEDIMWVSCPPHFEIVGATSPTANDVFPMAKESADTPYGILLKNQLQNTIVITCEKRPEGPPRATGTVCRECGAPMAPWQQYCSKCNFSFGN